MNIRKSQSCVSFCFVRAKSQNLGVFIPVLSLHSVWCSGAVPYSIHATLSPDRYFRYEHLRLLNANLAIDPSSFKLDP